MKKILINLIAVGCLLLSSKANAATDGYIVKVKDCRMGLMSVSDEVVCVGQGLYRVDNLTQVNNNFDKIEIEAVFPDYEFELFDNDYPVVTSDPEFVNQWYLNSIGAVSFREKGLSGRGVKIAVIDSGINASHPDLLGANVLQGYNCIYGSENTNDCFDNVGHGTMVAGLIAAQSDNENGICGIASNASIIPIKITDKNTLNMSSVFLGLEKALETDCDIINMSFGGAITDTNALSVMKEYIDIAEERGIIVVAAVGNSGHINNETNYPAGFDNVIGVGAVDESLKVSYYSQKNESVFVTAPGNNILSLFNDNAVTTGIGTSLSAPIVTAAVAAVKEINPGCTITDVKELLIKTSIDLGDVGYDINYGYGVLNLRAIVDELNDYIPGFIISEGILNSNRRIYIHNNTGTSCEVNPFFATYDGARLKTLESTGKLEILSGVTKLVNNRTYDCFLLWDSEFNPYTPKYIPRQN